jgi:NAD(P)-dependent dehydrogenase (short-subunit alcohol dehydrogenase family)
MAGGQRIVEAALDLFGRVDIVVNNAGIVRDRMIFNMTEEEWDAVIAVHLKGTFAVTRAVAPRFREQRWGRFVNMTSTSGLVGNVGQANYAAAKLGIVGLTRVTALDMARYGVTANCISPFAWTRLVGTIPTDTQEQKTRVAKLERMSPRDVAPLAVYLASEEAAGVSGQIFGVHGKEIFVFSQPRPVRSIHRGEGWTPERLAEVFQGTLGHHLVPLEGSAQYFSYDPLV